ncbi:hypothetical protein ACLKA7_002623 [Drosophila subpalustris]
MNSTCGHPQQSDRTHRTTSTAAAVSFCGFSVCRIFGNIVLVSLQFRHQPVSCRFPLVACYQSPVKCWVCGKPQFGATLLFSGQRVDRRRCHTTSAFAKVIRKSQHTFQRIPYTDYLCVRQCGK